MCRWQRFSVHCILTHSFARSLCKLIILIIKLEGFVDEKILHQEQQKHGYVEHTQKMGNFSIQLF
jgi:uncharacterized membrane protein